MGQLIYLLIIVGLFGPAVAGRFDSEKECEVAAGQLITQLEAEQRGAPKKIGCVGFPQQMPTAPEFKDA